MVFVMLPFSPEFDDVFPLVETVAFDFRLPCERGDSVLAPGSVPEQIMKQIREASLCVADISGNNPNVLFEVAYAHALGKPVILLSRDRPENAPFDVRHMRIIHYECTGTGLQKERLAADLHRAFATDRYPVSLLRSMLAPKTLSSQDGRFVIAANPLPAPTHLIRNTFGGTSSDNVGIRGLIQSFGLIYGHNHLPELVYPADYADEVFQKADMDVHLYCIASPKSNRWTGLMMRELNKRYYPRLEFRPDPESPDLRNVRVIVFKDGNPYWPHDLDRECDDPYVCDFGLILRAPNPSHPDHLLLILAGRSSLGTQAACLAAVHPVCIDAMARKGGLHLDDHHQPFAAVVSVRADKPYGKANADTLHVCEAFPLHPRQRP